MKKKNSIVRLVLATLGSVLAALVFGGCFGGFPGYYSNGGYYQGGGVPYRGGYTQGGYYGAGQPYYGGQPQRYYGAGQYSGGVPQPSVIVGGPGRATGNISVQNTPYGPEVLHYPLP